MRDDYKLVGPTEKITAEVELDVLKKLQEMATYKKLSVSEITNTALKRFITTHRDFLPPESRK